MICERLYSLKTFFQNSTEDSKPAGMGNGEEFAALLSATTLMGKSTRKLKQSGINQRLALGIRTSVLRHSYEQPPCQFLIDAVSRIVKKFFGRNNQNWQFLRQIYRSWERAHALSSCGPVWVRSAFVPSRTVFDHVRVAGYIAAKFCTNDRKGITHWNSRRCYSSPKRRYGSF